MNELNPHRRDEGVQRDHRGAVNEIPVGEYECWNKWEGKFGAWRGYHQMRGCGAGKGLSTEAKKLCCESSAVAGEREGG